MNLNNIAHGMKLASFFFVLAANLIACASPSQMPASPQALTSTPMPTAQPAMPSEDNPPPSASPEPPASKPVVEKAAPTDKVPTVPEVNSCLEKPAIDKVVNAYVAERFGGDYVKFKKDIVAKLNTRNYHFFYEKDPTNTYATTGGLLGISLGDFRMVSPDGRLRARCPVFAALDNHDTNQIAIKSMIYDGWFNGKYMQQRFPGHVTYKDMRATESETTAWLASQKGKILQYFFTLVSPSSDLGNHVLVGPLMDYMNSSYVTRLGNNRDKYLADAKGTGTQPVIQVLTGFSTEQFIARWLGPHDYGLIIEQITPPTMP